MLTKPRPLGAPLPPHDESPHAVIAPQRVSVSTGPRQWQAMTVEDFAAKHWQQLMTTIPKPEPYCLMGHFGYQDVGQGTRAHRQIFVHCTWTVWSSINTPCRTHGRAFASTPIASH